MLNFNKLFLRFIEVECLVFFLFLFISLYTSFMVVLFYVGYVHTTFFTAKVGESGRVCVTRKVGVQFLSTF